MVYKVYAIYVDNYKLSKSFYVLISIYLKEKSENIKKSHSNSHTDRYILPQHVNRLRRVTTISPSRFFK